jgi:hypothetical protein
MNQLTPIPCFPTPALIAAAGESAKLRFLELFTANIRNRNTRRAYAQAVREFLAWCGALGVPSITEVKPVHVATSSMHGFCAWGRRDDQENRRRCRV